MEMKGFDARRAYEVLMNLYAEQNGVVIEYTLEYEGEVTHHRTGYGNVGDETGKEQRKGA